MDERGVASAPIIGQVGHGLGAGRVAPAFHRFVLQAVDETHRRLIVSAVAFPVQRGGHNGLGECLVNGRADIQAIPIRALYHARCGLAVEPGHQGMRHDVLRRLS